MPPTNLIIEPVEGEPLAFIVHWDYPEEGSVLPTGFDVMVDGELFESTTYEGTAFEYSWYVGDQPCGSSLDVTVDSVNGEARAPSEVAVAETGGC